VEQVIRDIPQPMVHRVILLYFQRSHQQVVVEVEVSLLDLQAQVVLVVVVDVLEFVQEQQEIHLQ
jgi:hypothetical protein